jgi:glycosyltransferase involved in cell wall biosynthesis
MKYAVIIPAKNEENGLPVTLDSVVNQTLTPVCVLVVDDYSTDGTAEVVRSYMSKYPFVEYLFHNGNHQYGLGSPVVNAFHKGKEFLVRKNYSFDYLVKLDADINFPENTFEETGKFLDNHTQSYGIVSNVPYFNVNGKKKYRISPEWHTNGSFKVYNHRCLNEIGGLKTELGWDCADNIMAMEKNWQTFVIPYLNHELTRPIGRFSRKKGALRQGVGAYKLRHSILYVFFKAFHDMLNPPYGILGFCYLYGYFTALLKKEKRTLTKSQGSLLRRLLWKSFFYRLQKREFLLLQKENEK